MCACVCVCMYAATDMIHVLGSLTAGWNLTVTKNMGVQTSFLKPIFNIPAVTSYRPWPPSPLHPTKTNPNNNNKNRNWTSVELFIFHRLSRPWKWQIRFTLSLNLWKSLKDCHNHESVYCTCRPEPQMVTGDYLLYCHYGCGLPPHFCHPGEQTDGHLPHLKEQRGIS